MKPSELIEYLSECGAEISVNSDRIDIKAPRGVVTETIKTELTARKGEIIKLLDRQLTNNALIEILEKACTDLDLTPQQLWTCLSPEDIADIQAGQIGLLTIRAYTESWAQRLPLIPVGNDLPYPEPSETKTVTCSECQHFQPDIIGDGTGIGECTKGLISEKPLYPDTKRICDSIGESPSPAHTK